MMVLFSNLEYMTFDDQQCQKLDRGVPHAIENTIVTQHDATIWVLIWVWVIMGRSFHIIW